MRSHASSKSTHRGASRLAGLTARRPCWRASSAAVAVAVAPTADAKVFDAFVAALDGQRLRQRRAGRQRPADLPAGIAVLDAGTSPARTPRQGNGPGNNDFPMAFVDVDGDGSTFNSSTARIDVPADADVYFAGLYWGGNNGKWQVGSAGYGVNGEKRLSCQVSETGTRPALRGDGHVRRVRAAARPRVSVGSASATVSARSTSSRPTRPTPGRATRRSPTSPSSWRAPATGTHTVTVANVQAARGPQLLRRLDAWSSS